LIQYFQTTVRERHRKDTGEAQEKVSAPLITSDKTIELKPKGGVRYPEQMKVI
jgi:hypothetical protein